MNTIYLDSSHSDDARRSELYDGQVFVYAATESTQAFIDFARSLIEEAFQGLDPVKAQFSMPVEDYVAILAGLKPRFIHHAKSREFIQKILRERGCDPNLTYFDVPRLRTSTSDGYLTSGIAYAFHPHRDTWYSAPMCQINWWLPIYEAKSGNVMALHPEYFSAPIRNSSAEYNYQVWNETSRKDAAKHVKGDTRKQPTPLEEIELNPQIRIVTPPGGMLIFSAAQLHSSVPNCTGDTRFSIDFRTVHLGDLHELRGAPNLDSECSGTTLNDYLRLSDFAHIPGEVVERYLPGHPQPARLESAATVG